MTTEWEPFRAVSWSPNEKIGEPKMDAMAANGAWLFQNTPRAIYTLPGGLRRAEGIKIASGKIIVSKRNRSTAVGRVNFGNYFAYKCEPNITVGLISSGHPRVFCMLRGLGRDVPDERGFQAIVQIAIDKNSKKAGKKTIKKAIYVNWQAMGY